MGKNLPAIAGGARDVDSILGLKDTLERKQQPIPVGIHGKVHE